MIYSFTYFCLLCIQFNWIKNTVCFQHSNPKPSFYSGTVPTPPPPTSTPVTSPPPTQTTVCSDEKMEVAVSVTTDALRKLKAEKHLICYMLFSRYVHCTCTLQLTTMTHACATLSIMTLYSLPIAQSGLAQYIVVNGRSHFRPSPLVLNYKELGCYSCPLRSHRTQSHRTHPYKSNYERYSVILDKDPLLSVQ